MFLQQLRVYNREKEVNVLSLFDGISCGQLALRQAGINVESYTASEIDEKSIDVTMANFPDTIQIGDVNEIRKDNADDINLVMGGSPCQGFSFSGKNLNFDDPRSALFFEFARIVEEIEPDYFLLENVVMGADHANVISDRLGVSPVMINSALFGGQDRKRLYWTNIEIPELPNDSSVLLVDCLLEPDEKLFLSKEAASRYTSPESKIINPMKSNVIGRLPPYQGDRVFDVNGKASSLSASGGNNGGGGCNIIFNPGNEQLRRLSVEECEVLQGIPIGYTDHISKTARYKAIGNGWTIGVISHILSGMRSEGSK